MKGAVDGGLFIPHNTKRFPGYHVEKATAATNKRGKVEAKGKAAGAYNAKEHRDHIFGLHVQGYIDHLKKENKDKYKKQFNKWDTAITASKVKTVEELYKKLHADIRKAPKRVKAEKKQAPVRKVISKDKGLEQQNSKGVKWIRQQRLSLEQRKERIRLRIQKAVTKK